MTSLEENRLRDSEGFWDSPKSNNNRPMSPRSANICRVLCNSARPVSNSQGGPSLKIPLFKALQRLDFENYGAGGLRTISRPVGVVYGCKKKTRSIARVWDPAYSVPNLSHRGPD